MATMPPCSPSRHPATNQHLSPMTRRFTHDKPSGKVMPFWYVGSIVLGAVWTVLAWGDPGAGLVVAATALLVLSVLMSIALLVPINSRVAQWTDDSVPADGKQQI